MADCTITLDGDDWPELPLTRQRAILDRYLCHFELDLTGAGQIKRDDCNRPKLKIRQPDFACDGFDEVIERHGKEAYEAQSYIALNNRMTQLTFQWG